jgi:hypothetical protein
MDDEEAELRNPFPSPPSHYTNYTSHNLSLLSLLNEREASTADPEPRSQHQILSDQTDVPDWSLKQLEKPRVDWMLEGGEYTVFGDTWFVSVLERDFFVKALRGFRSVAGQGVDPFTRRTRRSPTLPIRPVYRYVFAFSVCDLASNYPR